MGKTSLKIAVIPVLFMAKNHLHELLVPLSQNHKFKLKLRVLPSSSCLPQHLEKFPQVAETPSFLPACWLFKNLAPIALLWIERDDAEPWEIQHGNVPLLQGISAPTCTCHSFFHKKNLPTKGSTVENPINSQIFPICSGLLVSRFSFHLQRGFINSPV